MVHRVADLDPNIKLECLSTVLSIVEHKDKGVAAKELGMSPSNVGPQLDKLKTAWGGAELFVRQGKTWEPTPFLTELLPEIYKMVDMWRSLSAAAKSSISIAFLPQHSLFVATALAALPDTVEVEAKPLGEQHRSEEGFARWADAVARGALDVLIGLGGEPPGARSLPLYQSRLVAMVPKADVPTGRTVELRDLVGRGRLLVAPRQARSRQRLENAIHKAGLAEKGDDSYVHLEAFGTKVLVAFGVMGHGTVVVPSDIAYPFQSGHLLAGAFAEDFEWVTVIQEGQAISHDVYYTTGTGLLPEATKLLIAELKKAVEPLNVRGKPLGG